MNLVAILAAGRSSRFGSTKALAEINGETLISSALRRAKQTGVSVVVVAGYDSEQWQAHLGPTECSQRKLETRFIDVCSVRHPARSERWSRGTTHHARRPTGHHIRPFKETHGCRKNGGSRVPRRDIRRDISNAYARLKVIPARNLFSTTKNVPVFRSTPWAMWILPTIFTVF